MLVYQYKPGVFIFEKAVEIEDGSSVPELATLTPPLPHIDDAVAVSWNASINQWEYRELPLPPYPVPQNYMDELLTYSQIRSMQYPSQYDYLDAVVKNDTDAIQAYMDACQAVKSRWPKGMDPITRREYYVQVFDMKLYIHPTMPGVIA